MYSKTLRFFCAVLIGLCPAAFDLRAQILYGSAVGNVRDSSDAAVAGAAVTITNTQTNQARQALTNETGAYSVNTLEPGTYTLRVTKEGFSAHTTSNVTVSINSVTRLDVTLSVGTVNETISVSAQSAGLQTDRSEVRAEIGMTSLQNLPVPAG